MNSYIKETELKIMKVLWEQEEPMSISEMIDVCKGQIDKKVNYIRIVVNALCDRGFLKCVGTKKLAKNYAAIYVPTMTKAEFAVNLIEPSEKEALQLVELLLNKYGNDLADSISKLLTQK